jgi:hypothetical protein
MKTDEELDFALFSVKTGVPIVPMALETRTRGFETDDVPPGVRRLAVAAQQLKRHGEVDMRLHEAGEQRRGAPEGATASGYRRHSANAIPRLNRGRPKSSRSRAAKKSASIPSSCRRRRGSKAWT